MDKKLKAKQLVERFRQWVESADKYNHELDSTKIYIAKQCALIACDEIMESFEGLSLKLNNVHQHIDTPHGISEYTNEFRKYWIGVREEIQQL